MSLLGAMLWDHRVVGDVVVVLRGGDDFARPGHRVIYDAVVELYDKVGAVDVVLVDALSVLLIGIAGGAVVQPRSRQALASGERTPGSRSALGRTAWGDATSALAVGHA